MLQPPDASARRHRSQRAADCREQSHGELSDAAIDAIALRRPVHRMSEKGARPYQRTPPREQGRQAADAQTSNRPIRCKGTGPRSAFRPHSAEGAAHRPGAAWDELWRRGEWLRLLTSCRLHAGACSLRCRQVVSPRKSGFLSPCRNFFESAEEPLKVIVITVECPLSTHCGRSGGSRSSVAIATTASPSSLTY